MSPLFRRGKGRPDPAASSRVLICGLNHRDDGWWRQVHHGNVVGRVDHLGQDLSVEDLGEAVLDAIDEHRLSLEDGREEPTDMAAPVKAAGFTSWTAHNRGARHVVIGVKDGLVRVRGTMGKGNGRSFEHLASLDPVEPIAPAIGERILEALEASTPG